MMEGEAMSQNPASQGESPFQELKTCGSHNPKPNFREKVQIGRFSLISQGAEARNEA
jgi:hypothetical protein